jgi:hypothetical protein
MVHTDLWCSAHINIICDLNRKFKFSSCILVKADVLFNYCPNSAGMWWPCVTTLHKSFCWLMSCRCYFHNISCCLAHMFQQVPTVELTAVLISGSWPCQQQKLNWVHKGHYINDKPQNRLQNSQLRRNERRYRLLSISISYCLLKFKRQIKHTEQLKTFLVVYQNKDLSSYSSRYQS